MVKTLKIILFLIALFYNSFAQSPGDIVINEILYYSQTGISKEWFEIYNKSVLPINLNNWKWKDGTNNIRTITTRSVILSQNSFAVICEDSVNLKSYYPNISGIILQSLGWNALNNTGDRVILYTSSGLVIDSVNYSRSWGGNNYNLSLERISPQAPSNDSANWSSSIDCEKATPARINSIINSVHYTYYDLVVNEIMFAPFSHDAEWIELYNPTDKTIDLSNWLMSETNGNYIIADTCRALIKPGDYVVFSSNMSIYNRYSYLKTLDSAQKVFIYRQDTTSTLGLNNDKDLVKITDTFGDMIDSVYYYDTWHNPNLQSTGVSLEKISPSLPSNDKNSWSSCALPIGGTPGLKNSIFTNFILSSSEISVYPNPFSPDGDGFEDFTIISYRITLPFSQSRVKIYDAKGRLVRTLFNNQTIGSNGSIIFDGFGDDKQKLRLGIYIIFFEALDDRNGIVEQLKTAVVVAAKL